MDLGHFFTISERKRRIQSVSLSRHLLQLNAILERTLTLCLVSEAALQQLRQITCERALA